MMVHVNDGDQFSGRCWVCGAEGDHDGRPHSEAIGDGLTRYDIVAYMSQAGVTWR